MIARYWQFTLILSCIAGPLPVLGSELRGTTVEDYRKFATEHDGDAGRGKLLFADEQKLGCAKCHSTDATGSKAGPDLFSIGDQFTRRQLIEAVLQPSSTIAVGYGVTEIATRDGESYQGVLKQSTDSFVELATGDGGRIRIPKRDVQEQRGSNVSLMPEGLQAGLTPQEFADLVEYLVSLKEPAHSMVNRHGMPDEIAELRYAVELRPLLKQNLRFRSLHATEQGFQPGLVWMSEVPGSPGVFLALDQAGLIWRIEKTPTGSDATVFADFSSEVFSTRGPNGLLGLAFHPRFAENRKYYLKYQVFEEGEIATVLIERIALVNCAGDSGRSERRLMKITSGAEHHNGGCIQFGPDGFLYVGMGDSAPNHDPQGHGQDLHLLLGKMLRIDVDHCSDGLNYGIPKDNPFVACVDVRPEIWASGLREPWRFSFDSITGDLWVGDLGQERGDEIDIVRRGENFGWNVYEGFELFAPARKSESIKYIAPIFSTRRKFGTTIIGGHIYRGEPKSSFYGVYIFGDYTSKRIWGLTQENRALKTVRQIAISPQSITAFTVNSKGNLYVVGYEGMVYALELEKANFGELKAEDGERRGSFNN